MTRFQRIDTAIVSGNPETAGDVATPPKRRTIHSKDRRLAARGTARRVMLAVWIRRDSPYRIRALEREKSLRNVGLDERYPACFSDKRDELESQDCVRNKIRFLDVKKEIPYV